MLRAPVFGQPGYEADLLYLAGLIALCLGEPDHFPSTDFWGALRTEVRRRDASISADIDSCRSKSRNVFCVT